MIQICVAFVDLLVVQLDCKKVQLQVAGPFTSQHRPANISTSSIINQLQKLQKILRVPIDLFIVKFVIV